MNGRLYLSRLERFCEANGIRVVRNVLVAGILGRVEKRRIVLRAGLSLGQQVLTLSHELTHLMLHCHAQPRIDRTVCEYEAEAVERWVGAVLKLASPAHEPFDIATVTDDLLACSVVRVRRAAALILRVAQDGATVAIPPHLHAQAAVQVDAATGEEITLNNELHGVRDFIRLTQPL
jgi:hypothetical protein